ncbi:hypothetical protein BC937DRAFT_91638 [Endogone sp. FLAS-F59071]|nr:hypothetical protein BC937DRAFT_91638 [Endogone sp. FLAS-F59071]|eukprot:RUS16069.1 hypothetical protein BC937DRAFT_91638 [Endogone sp. FLAS-F59071]
MSLGVTSRSLRSLVAPARTLVRRSLFIDASVGPRTNALIRVNGRCLLRNNLRKYLVTYDTSFASIPVAKRKSNPTVELLDEDSPELDLSADAFSIDQLPTSTLQSPEDATPAFFTLYSTLLSGTAPTAKLHELPRRSALKDLLTLAATASDFRLLPPLMAQWRRKQLPLTEHTTSDLVSRACAAGAPYVPFELLCDRATYALFPRLHDLRELARAFGERAVQSENETEALEELDRAFVAFGLAPYYDIQEVDWAGYGVLIVASARARAAGEEGWRRAMVTAEELVEEMGGRKLEKLLGDVRQDPHLAEEIQKKRATLIEAAEVLVTGYTERGEEEKAARFRLLKNEWEKVDRS